MNEVEALKLAPEFSTSEERRVLAEDALTLKCSRTSCAEPTVHLLARLVLDMADELAEVRADLEALAAVLPPPREREHWTARDYERAVDIGSSQVRLAMMDGRGTSAADVDEAQQSLGHHESVGERQGRQPRPSSIEAALAEVRAAHQEALEALRRIKNYPFSVMSDAHRDLRAVKDIAGAALAAVSDTNADLSGPTPEDGSGHVAVPTKKPGDEA